MKVGFVYDQVYLEHETGKHPESPERLKAILALLQSCGTLERLKQVLARPATRAELELVHQPRHIDYVRQLSSIGGHIGADTVVSPGTYKAAEYAAGGAICAVEAVMGHEADCVFALVRPPGHHATADQAMGFCLFNNVAVAAKVLLNFHNIKRLAILDFDVHHGNGTQSVFEAEPAVLYASIHQSPLYPGSGNLGERGTGGAAGTKVNIPLPPGCGDAEYWMACERVIIPCVERFRPEFILVSAGFDAHWAENIAAMNVSVAGFARIARAIKSLAARVCGGRMVFVLEGGYQLEALASSVQAVFAVLLGDDRIDDPLGPPPARRQHPTIEPLISRIEKVHGLA